MTPPPELIDHVARLIHEHDRNGIHYRDAPPWPLGVPPDTQRDLRRLATAIVELVTVAVAP